MKVSQLPILRGTIKPNRDNPRYWVLEVWCPFCQSHHSHGWDPSDGYKPTHRVAHCPPQSLFYKGGYRVAPWRNTDPEYAAMRPVEDLVRQAVKAAKENRRLGA